MGTSASGKRYQTAPRLVSRWRNNPSRGAGDNGGNYGKAVFGHRESPRKAKTTGSIWEGVHQSRPAWAHLRDLPKSKLGRGPGSRISSRLTQPIKGKEDIIKDLKKFRQSRGHRVPGNDPEARARHLLALKAPSGPAGREDPAGDLQTKSQKSGPGEHPVPRAIDQTCGRPAARHPDRLVGYELRSPSCEKGPPWPLAGRVLVVATGWWTTGSGRSMAFQPEEYWTLDVNLWRHKALCRPLPRKDGRRAS